MAVNIKQSADSIISTERAGEFQWLQQSAKDMVVKVLVVLCNDNNHLCLCILYDVVANQAFHNNWCLLFTIITTLWICIVVHGCRKTNKQKTDTKKRIHYYSHYYSYRG